MPHALRLTDNDEKSLHGKTLELKALDWTYIFRDLDGAYFIQPDMQYIIRPGGTGQIPNALVIGAQIGFNF